MLPFPNGQRYAGTHRKFAFLAFLSRRARVTNLGVILLASFAVVSLCYNCYTVYLGRHPTPYGKPSALLSTISRDPLVRHLSHLVVVPGHAIWTGTDPELRLREDQWALEPYQKGGGRVSAFFAHIFRGAELARLDEEALLVFSGGQTRSMSTTTEAESYMRLALAANVFHSTPFTLFIRATTEDHALDSFQNLLFSIARFHEYTGSYPNKITVVGYEFKRARFTDLHRVALRWPLEKFHYVGVDPDIQDHTLTEHGERNNAYMPYAKDLYGCHSPLLYKRRQRNQYTRFHSYYQSCPELWHLFDWCPSDDAFDDGGTGLFKGELPWSHA